MSADPVQQGDGVCYGAFLYSFPWMHSGRPVRTGQEVRGSSSNRSNFPMFDIFVETITFNAFFEDPGCTKGNA